MICQGNPRNGVSTQHTLTVYPHHPHRCKAATSAICTFLCHVSDPADDQFNHLANVERIISQKPSFEHPVQRRTLWHSSQHRRLPVRTGTPLTGLDAAYMGSTSLRAGTRGVSASVSYHGRSVVGQNRLSYLFAAFGSRMIGKILRLLMFGRPLDRGLCLFEAVLVPNKATALASLSNIRSAASSLILQ